MRAPFRPARAQRQNGRGSVQRRNLACLIYRQEQRALGRVHVRSDDVAHLVDEQRILRQLERVEAMPLQRERLPDTRDRRLAHATVLRETSCSCAGSIQKLTVSEPPKAEIQTETLPVLDAPLTSQGPLISRQSLAWLAGSSGALRAPWPVMRTTTSTKFTFRAA